ncbi:MAG: oxygen-independent coproporphyrinogen oxidase HemN [Pseudomonadota bacterium]|jgi:oxygen-independent coproporphyrinogen-3 oxidase
MNAAQTKYLTMAVPRYTSYPTVPHFTPETGATEYEGWLSRLPADRPVSLYLHVPFCRELCWYCGCNMKLASRYEPVLAYAKLLQSEIALLAARLPARMVLSHLHWGGGTPTALKPDDLAAVMATVRQHFDMAPDAEIAIESDPRTLGDDMITRIGALGFNRASFGVQEFDPKVQAAINRIQPADVVGSAVEKLRAAGVGNINFDLIYGLPFQTVDSLLATIAACAKIGPDRLALFGYAHVPWMAKKQRLIPTEALPGPAARLEMAEMAAAALQHQGYVPVGLDHFARPQDSLAKAAKAGRLRRNFQGYTTDSADTLLAVGATSIGRTPEGFVQNLSETGAWSRSVAAGKLPIAKGHAFSADDRLRGQIIEDLMCMGRADVTALQRSLALSDQSLSGELAALADYARDGIVTISGGVVAIPQGAQSLVRIVACVFDSYHKRQVAQHSLAV